MNQQEIYTLITLASLAIPPVLKAASGTIYGYCSKATIKARARGTSTPKWFLRSPEAMGHMVIGFIGGFLISPYHLTDSKWLNVLRSLIAIVGVFLYPVYNFVKRVKKHGPVFAESSYFTNAADATLGSIVGYIIGYVLYLTTQKGKKKEKFTVEKYSSYVMIIFAAIFFSAVVLKSLSTQGNRNC